MVSEAEDAVWVFDSGISAELFIENVRCHWRDVFMAEPEISAHKSLSRPMSLNDLFGERLRSQVVKTEAAMLYDLPPDFISIAREFIDRDRFPATEPGEQIEVCRGQNSEILTVLAIDPLKALSEHDANPGCPFGVGRGLA